MDFSLFRIVRHVGEETRIKLVPFIVMTLDDNPMFVCHQKFFIQQERPLSMSELTMTVSEELPFQLLFAGMGGDKIFERVR